MGWFVQFASIFLIIILIGSFGFRRVSKPERLLFFSAAILKIVAGMVICYVYLKFFDGGDSWRYFIEAEKIFGLYKDNHLSIVDFFFNNSYLKEADFALAFSNEPRALFFTKIVFLLFLVSGGNFWVLSVYLSLFSFICLWIFYRELKNHHIVSRYVAQISLFFWPSVIFWSSGIVKESFSAGLIAVLAAIILIFRRTNRITVVNGLLFLLLGYLLFKIKYYYGAVFIPLSLCYVLVNVFMARSGLVKTKKWLQLMLFSGLLVCLILLVSRLHPNLHLNHVGAVIVNNYQLFKQKSDPEKMVFFESLKPELGSFLAHSPKALFTGWFRPSFFDIQNIWSLLAAAENCVLFILFLFQLWQIRSFFRGDVLLNLSVLIFCVAMAVFLSYSAPNFGTLVRYKVGFLPFLLMLFLNKNVILEWLKNKISGIGKIPDK